MAAYYPDSPGIYKWAKGFRNIEFIDLKYLGALVTRYTWIPAALSDSYRKKANFLWSEFVGFDVDNTSGEPYTLEQAISDWSDSACVIGVTRSHQKEKITDGAVHPPADRFRIITQWERRIESIEEYEYNTRSIVKNNEHFDAACIDATRCFYPCAKIVYANFDGFKQPVFPYKNSKTHIVKQLRDTLFINRNDRIPNHIKDFIENGIIFGEGRNESVYVTTIKLLRCGIDLEKVIALIEKSPFDRASFSNQEMRRTIESAARACSNE